MPRIRKAADAERAKDQARAQLDNIIKMVDRLDATQDSDLLREDAETAIREDALSVQVRSDWHGPGSANVLSGEFEILLCTGGPAVRIIGTLSEYQEPDDAHIEYQDWFTPWKEYLETTSEERNKLLAYCHQFYFGG